MIRLFGVLWAHEARRLARDRFLVGMSVYVVAVALAMRWLLPWLQVSLRARVGFDLSPYLGVATSYFVVVNTSVLTGLVAGFLLLELKAQGILRALRVTPVPVGVHLAALGAAVVAAGLVLAVGLGLAIGVGTPGLGALAVSAALGAPSGLVIALIIATLAADEVQAFAVLKFVSLFGLVPVGGYFLPEPWGAAAGVVPLYWAAEVWWHGPRAAAVVAGLVVTAAWLVPLARRFSAHA